MQIFIFSHSTTVIKNFSAPCTFDRTINCRPTLGGTPPILTFTKVTLRIFADYTRR